jgi:hypothetical protein
MKSWVQGHTIENHALFSGVISKSFNAAVAKKRTDHGAD